ncbi:MAG: hypothetical protein KC621_20415 [Myxococcales bacterium]|nr:hypothetical protein [Myxococcales bacterium]
MLATEVATVPPWVELQHDGFVASWGPTRGELGGCLGIWLLCAVYTLMMAYGFTHEPLNATMCFMSMFLGLWLVAFGMAFTLTDRFELRVTPGDLVLNRWRWGRKRRWRKELAGAKVDTSVVEMSKGGTLIVLSVTDAAGDELRIQLPSGNDLRDRATAKEHLAWMASRVRSLAEDARPPDDDPVARAAVERLLDPS